MTDQISAASYDEWHAQLAPDDGRSTPWHQLAAQLIEAVGGLYARSVLEIGCGRGGFAAWLSQSGASVTACDYSGKAVEIARREFGSSGVTWQQADIQRLPFLDDTFDVVTSCETIEHVPRPALAVRELARVLRPGGVLVLTTPNYLGSMGLYRLYLRLRGRQFTEEGQPINQLTMLPRTLLWLARSGLRVERTCAVGHYLPFPGRPPIRFSAFDRVPGLKVFALHSAVRARKPTR
jgi:2-polyprenyl-6-hydroxyphenyl methylase/3-demethylubiquinone-9 3-methyltransferase